MHLHFIFPHWQKLLEDRPELKDTVSGYDIGAFRMIGLGQSTAAGAVPEEHRVTLLDQNIEAINYAVEADLICIGFFTPQASNAYNIADKFRTHGYTVIAGGIHPTMAPIDTLQHFDAIVEGPVEGLWDTILADFSKGQLKSRYVGNQLAPFAKPKRELFNSSTYLKAGVVQTARGCNKNCKFCVVPPCYGKSITYRAIDEVIYDIATLSFPCFFFADENLLFSDTENKEYMRELMHQIIEKRIRKISFVANYPSFIKSVTHEDWLLLAKSNMRQVYLVLGLMDSLYSELSDKELRSKIKQMQQAGVEVLGSFTLGHDKDNKPVESLIEDFCHETKINLAEFTLFTPFPGTNTYSEMEASGRILTKDWALYNAANVVFAPLHESPHELEQRYLQLWQTFYSRIGKTDIHQRYVKGFGAKILG